MYVKSITKDEVSEMPLIQFEGKIIIATTPDTITRALEEIKDFDIVGFDTESKPAFKKGQFNHVAMVQISTHDTAYLLRISKWGIISALEEFLTNTTQLKIGLALDDDIKALQKRQWFEPGSFIDLNKYVVKLGVKNAGVRNLSGIFMGRKVSKSQQTSNWESEHLSPQQQTYAATDAWICLKIWDVISAIESRQSGNE